MPPATGRTLPPRLAWLTGVIAYGTSAKGNTLAAYRDVEDRIIGGRLNIRRAFESFPGPGHPPTIYSTKLYSAAHIADRHAAFAAYGKPAIDIFHHEPFPGNPPDPADYGPDRYDLFLERAEAVLEDHPLNVARALCVQRADITDGTLADAIPEKPPWLDCILFDAYRDKYPGRTAKELITPCMEVSEEWGIPWGLAEWGVAGPALERIRWAHDLVELCCNDRRCIALVNFQSDIGKRAPTNYDGTKAWSIEKSQDRHTPEMATFWRDLATITRWEAAKQGSPAGL